MLFSLVLARSQREVRSGRRSRRPLPARGRPWKPWLEVLEDRNLPAVIDVLGHLPLDEYNQFIASHPTFKDWGNEPSIAVNPTDPNKIAIVTFNYPIFVSQADVAGKDGVWYSTDGGADWGIRFPVPTNPVPGAGTPNDQKIAYDSAGNLHAAMLTFGNQLNVYDGLTADPNADGVNGRPTTVWTWDTTRANVPAITNNTADQPWLALGPNGSGGVSDWVAYDSFRGAGAQMRVSVDSGADFNLLQDNQVSNGVQPPTFLQTNPGLRIATDGLGNAYTIFGVGDAAGPNNTTHVLYRLNMSSDNGASWKYTASTTTGGLTISDNDATTFSTQLTSSFAGVNRLTGNITSVAAQGDGSHIYAAFGMKDGPNGTGTDRIYVAEFHPDGLGGIVKRVGVVAVSIPGQRAALPSLAVTDNGVVALQYDTFDGTLIHVHLATSSDTGLTWNDQDLYDFNPSGIQIPNTRLLGDYQDLEALGNTVYGTFSARGNVNAGGINTTDKDVPFFYALTFATPPTVTPPANQGSVEGVSHTFDLGSFTDPDGGPWAVDINWGDGGPHDMFSVNAPGLLGTLSHTYGAEGTNTVTITVTDTLDNQSDSKTFTVTVTDGLGLLLLDSTGSQSLKVTGNGSVSVSGHGAAVVDSSDDQAAFLAGNATVAALDIDVTGGVKTAGHGSFSGPVDQEAATSDPLGLSLPAPPSPTFDAVHYSDSAPITLLPGTYIGGIDISGQASVTLAPGVYYLQGGGFSISGQGSVSGTGVTIINAPAGPDDTIRVSGQGSLSLTAPASDPFQGVVFFQDPNSSNPIQFTGQASVTLAGVVYVPAAPVSIDGKANVTINGGPGTAVAPPPILGALIAYDLQVDGNGVLIINPDDPPSVSSPAVAIAAPSSAGTGGVAFAALGVPVSGSGSVTAPGEDSLVQTAIMLSRNSPAIGNNSSPAPAAPSNTSAASPTIVDPLFSSNSGGTGAALSGASKGVKSNSSTANGVDPLSEQLVDAVFTSL